MTRPALGPRDIDDYNRLARDLAAFNFVLRKTKPGGTVRGETLMALNGLINIANRLFRRHTDLPRFVPVDVGIPMAMADLSVIIARLTLAALLYQERYRHLTASARPYVFNHDPPAD